MKNSLFLFAILLSVVAVKAEEPCQNFSGVYAVVGVKSDNVISIEQSGCEEVTIGGPFLSRRKTFLFDGYPQINDGVLHLEDTTPRVVEFRTPHNNFISTYELKTTEQASLENEGRELVYERKVFMMNSNGLAGAGRFIIRRLVDSPHITITKQELGNPNDVVVTAIKVQ